MSSCNNGPTGIADSDEQGTPALCRSIAASLEAAPEQLHPDFPLPRPDQLLEAAVLVPLVERPSGLNVVLTRRSEALNRHAGQISFPGGRVDRTDHSPLAAALREAHEEVGLVPARVQVLGSMPRYPTGTGFMIHPFVGYVRESGLLVPEPSEVAEIFEVPLAFFLDPANHHPHRFERDGRVYHLHAMPYGDYYIWGATAAILRELYTRLRGESPELLP